MSICHAYLQNTVEKQSCHGLWWRGELEYPLKLKKFLRHSLCPMAFCHDTNKASFTKTYTAAPVGIKTYLMLLGWNLSDSGNCPAHTGVSFSSQLRFFRSFYFHSLKPGLRSYASWKIAFDGQGVKFLSWTDWRVLTSRTCSTIWSKHPICL